LVINPKIYMEQLEELGLEDLEIEPSSRGEAVKLIREIEDHISNLNKIRYNLHGACYRRGSRGPVYPSGVLPQGQSFRL